MVQPKVLIGVATGEYARRADFYDYLHLLEKPKDTFLIFCHDRSPAKARNILIEAAAENGCTHLLLVDDDMALKPDALMKLLSHDLDIVSGLYLSGAYPHAPVAFDIMDDDGRCHPIYLFDKKESLIPIVAAGFGFLLLKMSVFDKLEKPFVRLGELDAEQWCDDIGFFNRVKAAGIQSYLDLDVCVGHIRTCIFWPNKNPKTDIWYTGYDTNGTGWVNTPQFDPKVGYEIKESVEVGG